MIKYSTFLITFIISFANVLIFYTYPFILGRLGIAEGVAGIIVAVATGLTLLFRLVTGVFIDRKLPKFALTQVSLIYLAAFMMLQSDLTMIVIVGRVLLGCGLGVISILLMYYSVSSTSKEKEKPGVISMMTFFGILPTCIAPFLALKIKKYFGVEMITIVATISVLVSLALAFLTDFQFRNHVQVKQMGNTRDSLLALLSNRNINTVLLLLIMTYTISGTTVTFLPGFFEKNGISDSSWYFLIFSFSMVAPRFLLKNKMPNGETFPTKLLSICIILSLFGNLLNLQTSNHVLLGMAALFNGLTLGMVYPAIMSYVLCASDKTLTGSASAIVSSAADIGVILSNLAIGVMINLFSIKISLYVPIVASLISLTLIIVHLLTANESSETTQLN